VPPVSDRPGSETAMLVSPSILRTKRVRETSSVSDSNVESHPIKDKKILRSRIIGTDSGSDGPAPIVLSNSPVSSKVRGGGGETVQAEGA